MNWWKTWWDKPTISKLIKTDLYQAQRDLLEAYKLLEYATALTESLKVREARLRGYAAEETAGDLPC